MAYTYTILEYDFFDRFPTTGSVDTIYIDTSTSTPYRWNDEYIQVSTTDSEIWGILGTVLAGGGGGGVTSVSGTAPIASSGGSTPTISIATANTSTNGALSSTDWNTFNNKQNALVSGTNIKTIEGQSLLGSGNINITASDVGLGNVDNTSDLNKPISTATQTALNAKQNTLTLTTTGTSGAATLVGATLNIPQYSGGSGASGIHNLLKPVSGRRISYALSHSVTGANFTLARLTLVPFIPANSLTISEILMYCNILGVGSLCRLLIYSDNNGLPNAKLYESADLDLSTTGFKIATTTFTFNASTTYWLGFHGGGITANVMCNNVAAVYTIGNLGATVNGANGYNVTAALGSAPANITSYNLNTAAPQWIGLTPA